MRTNPTDELHAILMRSLDQVEKRAFVPMGSAAMPPEGGGMPPGGGSGVQQYDLTAMLPENNTIYGNQPDIVTVVATPLGVSSSQVSASLIYFEAMA